MVVVVVVVGVGVGVVVVVVAGSKVEGGTCKEQATRQFGGYIGIKKGTCQWNTYFFPIFGTQFNGISDNARLEWWGDILSPAPYAFINSVTRGRERVCCARFNSFYAESRTRIIK